MACKIISIHSYRGGNGKSNITANLAYMLVRQNRRVAVVDTHPGLNEETLLAIAVSDKLIVIMRPDQQDFEGSSVTLPYQ